MKDKQMKDKQMKDRNSFSVLESELDPATVFLFYDTDIKSGVEYKITTNRSWLRRKLDIYDCFSNSYPDGHYFSLIQLILFRLTFYVRNRFGLLSFDRKFRHYSKRARQFIKWCAFWRPAWRRGYFDLDPIFQKKAKSLFTPEYSPNPVTIGDIMKNPNLISDDDVIRKSYKDQEQERLQKTTSEIVRSILGFED